MGNCVSAEVWASDELCATKGPVAPKGQTREPRTAVASSSSQGISSAHSGQSSLGKGGEPASPSLLCQRISADSGSCRLSCCSSLDSLILEGHVEEEYRLGQQLGAGRSGSVLACARRADGREFACKIITNNSGIAGDAFMEVEVLRQLRGQPGVVQLEVVYRDLGRPGLWTGRETTAKSRKQRQQELKDGSLGVERVQIVMERCYGGTLAERLQKGPLSEPQALIVMRSIVRTLHVLHSHGFIYRDIKDTNFLFRDTSPESDVVAIDFGLAATYKQGELLSSVAGSPLYIAPEVVRRAYTPKCDVWSAGVLCYQLIAGRHPFVGDSVTAVLKQVTSGGEVDLQSAPWPAVSEGTKQLIRSMLTRDPNIRPSPAELLEAFQGCGDGATACKGLVDEEQAGNTDASGG